jgi:hypothetical protein
MHRSSIPSLTCAAVLLIANASSAAAQSTPEGPVWTLPCSTRYSMPVHRPNMSLVIPMPSVGAPDTLPLRTDSPKAERERGQPRDSMPALRPDTSGERMPRLVPPAPRDERATPRDSLTVKRGDCPGPHTLGK